MDFFNLFYLKYFNLINFEIEKYPAINFEICNSDYYFQNFHQSYFHFFHIVNFQFSKFPFLLIPILIK